MRRAVVVGMVALAAGIAGVAEYFGTEIASQLRQRSEIATVRGLIGRLHDAERTIGGRVVCHVETFTARHHVYVWHGAWVLVHHVATCH